MDNTVSNNQLPAVEVFADIVCPYAYVGLTRLLAERDRRRSTRPLWIRSWPLELVNNGPIDGAHILVGTNALRASIAPELFAGANADSIPRSSLPALALAGQAYDRDPATGEQVSMQLRRTLFEDGVNIGDGTVLDRIAAAHGLDRDEQTTTPLADLEEGRARGVVGSPHFFVDTYSSFCPALTISKVDGALQVAMDDAAFEELATTCFGEYVPPTT